MREVYWAFIPPVWMPYPGRAAKLKHLQTINTLIAAHINARTRNPSDIGTRNDVLDMLLAAEKPLIVAGGGVLTSVETVVMPAGASSVLIEPKTAQPVVLVGAALRGTGATA